MSDQPTINDVELNAAGQTNFWENGEQRALVPHQYDTWLIYTNFRNGKATPIATLTSVNGGWKWLHVNDTSGRRPRLATFTDWRDAVRDALGS